MSLIIKGRTTLAGATTVGWSPAALFSNGEQGAWYDPSDFERYMATGSELVVNGSFNDGAANWTPAGDWTIADGKASKLATTTNSNLVSSASTTIGKSYLVTFDAEQNSSGIQIWVGGSTGNTTLGSASTTGTGTKQVVITVTGNTGGSAVLFRVLAAGTAVIDNISVRELPAISTATMFTDTAGTTPVTAVGQQVARINDKSGRGNHATQATAGNRPVLQVESGKYYLEFNGATNNRWLQTGNIDFTGTNKMSVFAGAAISSSARGFLAELSDNATGNAGAFYLYFFGTAFYYGSSGTSFVQVFSSYTAPATKVYTGLSDISAPSVSLRDNGVAAAANTTTSQGTGNYGNWPLYIGRRALGGSDPLNGRIYQLIIVGRTATAREIAATEALVNRKTGAY